MKHLTTTLCILALLTLLGSSQPLYAQLGGENAPPVVANPFEDGLVKLIESDPPLQVDPNDIFSDPDGDVLTFTLTEAVTDASVATVALTPMPPKEFSCTDCMLDITPVQPGVTQAEIRASDGQGHEAVYTFTIEVGPNQPPSIVPGNPLEGGVLVRPGETVVITLCYVVFVDPDDDCETELGFPVMAAMPSGIATVTQGPYFGFQALFIEGIGLGTASATVSAQDPFNPPVSLPFDIAVFPNRPPEVANPFPNDTVALDPDEGEVTFPLNHDATPIFSDPDGDVMTFNDAGAQDPTVAEVDAVQIFGSDNWDLIITPNAVGQTTGWVTAMEGEGMDPLSTTYSFTVIVDHRPEVDGCFPNDLVTLKVDDPPVTGYANNCFTDPEGEAMTFTAGSDDPGVATVEIVTGVSPPVPQYRIDGLAVGTTTGWITATDPHGLSSTYTFTIHVSTGGAPTLVNPIQDDRVVVHESVYAITCPLQGATYTIPGCSPYLEDPNGGGIFDDPDGDLLAFSQSQPPDPTVATLNLIQRVTTECGGSYCWELKIFPQGVGQTTAQVQADDGNGNTLAYTFTIQVVTGSPPVVVGPLGDVVLLAGPAPPCPPRDFRLDTIFADPDPGDVLSYTASSSNPSAVLAEIVHISDPTFSPPFEYDALRLTGHQPNVIDVVITVTAHDTGGNSTTDSTRASVRNSLCTPASKAGESTGAEVPRVLALHPNYPNPFNPATHLTFTVPEDGRASLVVYDVLGREVVRLFDGVAAAGIRHEVTFEAGAGLATGVYFARLSHGNRVLTQRLLLVK